jgi:flagellar biosynthesis/type III secretory pathway protein FliH
MKAKMRTNTEPEVTTDMSTTTDTSTTVESENDDTIALDRNLYKSIKKMDRATLEGLIQDIYENGRKKGLKEAQELINTSENLVQQAEVLVAKGQKTVDEVTEKIEETGNNVHTVDFDTMRDEIRGISGIGEKRADSIMEIVRKYIRE